MQSREFHPSARRPAGFTLVELLVVMSIIALLAGLLLPAVNAVRERGRQAKCSNNMRQVSLALINSASSGSLPGWVVPRKYVREDDTEANIGATWVWEILDEIEGGSIKRSVSPGGVFEKRIVLAVNEQNTAHIDIKRFVLPVLKCPNDTSALEEKPHTSYAVNAGMPDRSPTQMPTGLGGLAAPHGQKNVEGSATAVFHNHWTNNPSKTQVPLAYISSGDGTSNTILVGENVDASTWTQGFNSEPTNLNGSGPGTIHEGEISLNWVNVNVREEYEKAMPNWEIDAHAGMGRTSSYHPGGAMMSFCDGRVTFIDENVNWQEYFKAFTPRGDLGRLPGLDKVSNKAILWGLRLPSKGTLGAQ